MGGLKETQGVYHTKKKPLREAEQLVVLTEKFRSNAHPSKLWSIAEIKVIFTYFYFWQGFVAHTSSIPSPIHPTRRIFQSRLFGVFLVYLNFSSKLAGMATSFSYLLTLILSWSVMSAFLLGATNSHACFSFNGGTSFLLTQIEPSKYCFHLSRILMDFFQIYIWFSFISHFPPFSRFVRICLISKFVLISVMVAQFQFMSVQYIPTVRKHCIYGRKKKLHVVQTSPPYSWHDSKICLRKLQFRQNSYLTHVIKTYENIISWILPHFLWSCKQIWCTQSHKTYLTYSSESWLRNCPDHIYDVNVRLSNYRDRPTMHDIKKLMFEVNHTLTKLPVA